MLQHPTSHVTLTASSNLIATEANITTLVSPFMSNVYFSGMGMEVQDLIANDSVTACNNIMSGNMAGMLGVFFTSNCPITHSALANYLHEGEGGAIDYSWIHYPFSIQTTMNDLFQLAGEGYQLYSALKGLYNLLNPSTITDPLGGTNQALTDAIQDALNGLGDSNSSNQKLTVSWSNITSRPIANSGNNLVAVNSNLGFGQSLVSISPGSFMTDQWGNPKFIFTPTQKVIIDPSQNAYLNSVTCSNYMGSNGSLAFNNYNTSLQYVATPTTGGSNAYTSGYLNITDTTFNFLTQASNTTTQISQMQVDNTGKLQVANNVSVPTLYADAWKAKTNTGSATIGSNQFVLSLVNSTYSTSNTVNTRQTGQLTLSDTSMNLQFTPSQLAWGMSNGPPQPIVALNCTSNGALYVASNVWSQSPLLLRATLPALLDGDSLESRISLSSAGFQLQNIETGLSNLTNVWFSVNSNACFPLSTSNMKFCGNYETNTVFNPTSYSNVTLSNFARLEASFVTGLSFGYGLSNTNIFPNQNVFNVDPNGQIFTLQTPTGFMQQITDSNANIIRGNMTLCNDGSISVAGQPFVLAGGSIKRASPSAFGNQGFLLSPTGYLTMGNLQIYPDGTINMNSKTIIDNTGRFFPRAEESGSSYRAATATRPTGATVFSR